MNPPKEISPEYADSLVSLLCMMGDLDREALGFLVGHMAGAIEKRKPSRISR
jgi:hypothetical protein